MTEPGLVHVIDDDGPVRESTACLLQAMGFDVREWKSATAFLAEAAFAKDDVVLVDYRLDDMTGLEMLDRLAGRGPLPAVVLMSGHYTAPAEMTNGVQFLAKPFDLDALLAAIAAARRTAGA